MPGNYVGKSFEGGWGREKLLSLLKKYRPNKAVDICYKGNVVELKMCR